MAFQEKSAWIMSISLLASGIFYFTTVISMSGSGQLVPPNVPVLIVYTVILTVIVVIGHIVIALSALSEANAKLDERERRIFDRAGHLSGNVFGVGIIASLLLFLLTRNGDLLFYTAFGSLILGQLLEYLMQIFFYRASAV